MQNIVAVWEELDGRRRGTLVGAALILAIALVVLLRIATAPAALGLLYAGLDPQASGGLLSALDQRGIAYEVRGDAIWVPRDQRDSLRLELAGEGLPASGGVGYELLDGLTGFGTTAQMFDAAYWRAKEGELARTIVAGRSFTAARVHIAVPPGQAFRTADHPTAAVTVTPAGPAVTPEQARALRHLVGAAVTGMSPRDVSVIDAASGRVLEEGDEGTPRAVTDRAADLRQSVLRLLEARVGAGRARVEIAIEAETEREAITERKLDPQGRVPISTETQERSDSSNNTAPAATTVASNLPAGQAQNGGTSQSNGSETRERTNYEVSETTRELLRSPGAIRRMTVAVLVDGITTVAADGSRSWQPRPEAEIAQLRDLVSSAVGFDQQRGDVITLQTLAFEPIPESGTLAEGGGLLGQLDITQLIMATLVAAVALALGLFVLRPLLLGPPRAAATAETGDALTGEITEEGGAMPDMTLVSGLGGDGFAMGFGGFEAPQDEEPVDRLRRLIGERRVEAAQILRGWMEERDEEKVG
ncbi:flagellar basal-body MS-ring/collar protein FliF [Frigidibacter sp. MR17.14]|uniref:flagellar basal-body MS-ring/collar protein FliF n=1 Tax=Frigidibacter sp. MR17.14 TaxID=3126509 RepID=UPI003012E0D8